MFENTFYSMFVKARGVQQKTRVFEIVFVLNNNRVFEQNRRVFEQKSRRTDK